MKVTTWIEVVSSSSQVETGLKRIINVAGDFADIINNKQIFKTAK